MTSSPWEQWQQVRATVQPQVAVVLGSGLGHLPLHYREAARVAYAEIPELTRGTVPGHTSCLSVGWYQDRPLILALGRLHLYEGLSLNQATALIRRLAEQKIQRIILTNAAGSLHPSLTPGSILSICAHYQLVGTDGWRSLARCQPVRDVYAQHLYERLQTVPQGIYAAVTGPCYETPAEVQALVRCGVAAVGMSTAWEAEEAQRLGLEVVALSCLTNYATGIAGSVPHHAEVLQTSQQAHGRMWQLIASLLE